MFYLQNSLTKISIFQIIRKIQIKFWKVFLNFEVLHFNHFFYFQSFKLAKSLVASMSLTYKQNFVENKLYLSSILRFIILKNFNVLHFCHFSCLEGTLDILWQIYLQYSIFLYVIDLSFFQSFWKFHSDVFNSVWYMIKRQQVIEMSKKGPKSVWYVWACPHTTFNFIYIFHLFCVILANFHWEIIKLHEGWFILCAYRAQKDKFKFQHYSNIWFS